jgi:hypothetical protein
MMMNSKRGVGIEKAKTAAEQQQQQQESKRESALHISFSKSSLPADWQRSFPVSLKNERDEGVAEKQGQRGV